jgi:hypothetical protein
MNKTEKEIFEMYMKLPKKKLVEMLIKCNSELDHWLIGSSIDVSSYKRAEGIADFRISE